MSIVDVIADRAHNRILTARQETDFNAIKHLEDIYKLLQSEKYYSEGIKHLCFACDNISNIDYDADLLKLCIQSSRVFLYQKMLEDKDHIFDEDNLFDSAQKAFYSLASDIILTKEQKDLFDLFITRRRLVVSAPTSFGKSRIMREIIAHCKYNNIVVIVPTNALLSETYFTFRMDERLSEYNLIFSTHIQPNNEKSIYIFTPEKFDLYTDEYNINYEFFIFDEVYKIDSNDNRASVFSNCLYKAYKKRCDYYLIGPYFNDFSPNFIQKTNGYFKKYNTDIVQKSTINYLEDSDILIDGVKLKKLLGKDSRLGQIINKVQGQTIIYVSRKDTAETRAKNISNTVSTFTPKPELTDLIEYISKNISEQWGLITCLKKGIAFHHSGVPKFIQTEIVELFNSGLINIIVCTPTLTEGVNTSAKNVVFYDTTKANINLTGFEVKNIIGRSGRFGQHFVGRAIFLEKHVEQDNIDEIRFPFFDYDQLPLEDYLQIEDNDLPPSGLKRKDTVISMALQQRVPIDVLRKNKYINFEKQLSLIKYLKENPLLRGQLYIKHKLPDKAQVDLIMYLIHDILFSDSDKKDTWTTGNLSRLVKYQIYYNPSIKQLITQHSAKKEDTKIRNILELVYRYFEFSLPKYIIALENILNFVYGDDVSLGMMATHLQYGSDETYNILLTDAGVPKSIISHLSPYIKDTGNIKEIKATIERSPHSLKGLSTIEIKMLSKRI